MQLTPQQITGLASDLLEQAKALAAAIEAGMAKLNAHNATTGAKPANPGPFSVALGTATTVVEQLAKHVRENTPAPAAPVEAPAA